MYQYFLEILYEDICCFSSLLGFLLLQKVYRDRWVFIYVLLNKKFEYSNYGASFYWI